MKSKMKKKLSISLKFIEKCYSYFRGFYCGILLGSSGKKCFINRSSKIINPYKVFFGNRVRLAEYVILSAAWKTGKINLEDDVIIHQFSSIFTFGGTITLRSRVGIGPYCLLYGHGGLEIGEDTMIAGHCKFIPAQHNFNKIDIPIRHQGSTKKGISIGKDCWLGIGTTVLDGVTIGNGCIIGSGSIVNKSLPDYSISYGVPCQVQKYRVDS